LGYQDLADMAYALLLLNAVLAGITLAAMIGLMLAHRGLKHQRLAGQVS